MEPESKLGVEAIKAELVVAEDVAIAVKKVLADHKVDLSDIVHVVELAKKSDHFVAAAKALKEVWPEIKDVDVLEGVTLLQDITAKVHEVEKA